MIKKNILFTLLCLLPIHAIANDSTAVAPKVVHTAWYSHHERFLRRVDIYLPAAYDTCTQPLPVLYLLHGINGYEGSWVDKGFVIDTLLQLIESGLCQPTILVMPDCNRWPFRERPIDHGNLWRCVIRYPRLSHEHEVERALSDLIDMIDTTYYVSSCAMAGLSDGGRIAANTANRRPDRIRTIGLFSPVLYKDQIPHDSTQTYYIYVGTSDMFYPSGNRFHRRLTKAGYPHDFIRLQGSHNWKIWKQCVSDFLKKL